MKTTRHLVLLIAFTMTLGLLAACAIGSGISSEPMPEGKSYSGLWYSDQFQHMYLIQDGNEVTGVYSYAGGGTIEGEVEGNLLLFDWDEPGDREQLRQGRNGKGFFHFVTERQMPELVGEWGYKEDRAGGGPWTAEFVREIKEDDPTTVEEILELY